MQPQHSQTTKMQFKLSIATVPALLCDKLKHYANFGQIWATNVHITQE